MRCDSLLLGLCSIGPGQVADPDFRGSATAFPPLGSCPANFRFVGESSRLWVHAGHAADMRSTSRRWAAADEYILCAFTCACHGTWGTWCGHGTG